MAKEDVLKSDGLTDAEIALLLKPIAQLTVAELPYAVSAKDRHGELNRKANAEYISDRKKTFYVQSDCLDRVLNPATGKYYDSKSKYYADLKATGHVVVESGIVPEKREQRGDYNVYKELKEAAQQHGLIS